MVHSRPRSLVPHTPAPSHRISRNLLLVLALLGGLLCATPAFAQELVVRVTGPFGAVPDATVDVLFRDVSLMRDGTDDRGIARFQGLARGTYAVRVEVIGYETGTVADVRLASEVVTVEVELEQAPIELEGITVQAARVQIQRENTDFSTSVDHRAIQLLPVTHNASDLVSLTPGARPGHVWGGASLQANNYRIDGLSANHPGMGGDLLKPNVNWIESLSVRGLGAGAELGGFQGGLIDVETKSGTNDFQGFVRTSFEDDFLKATNLVETEIGQEVVNRIDLEGEVRGPLIRDRLFYYVAGSRVSSDARALNHLRWIDGHYTPFNEETTETKAFGKLTWTPAPRRRLELSGAYTGVDAENYGITGYEGENAAHAYSSPTYFINAAATEILGDLGSLQARVNHFSRDERYDPYVGEDVPGVRTFALSPPYNAFNNAPFTLRSAPSSTSGTLEANLTFNTGSWEHGLRMGAEYTKGSFLDRRVRNGGMTWQAVNSNRFDPSDPGTWSHVTHDRIPTAWGGEVHLDAEVSNAAAYAQSAISIGQRVVFSPGIRWNEWTGWITPRDGQRFQAVTDQGLDPRVGISVDLTGHGTFVAKAHWGRYHQHLISEMFDRAAGADVFTNEEFWYYNGGDITDPSRTFTEAERNADTGPDGWSQFGEITLNETGPVVDYRQPYTDQWLVGLEKEISHWGKVEVVYTRRQNHDMVALVDRNRGSNYTRFEDVRVYQAGQPLPFSGGSVVLEELWVPNNSMKEAIIACELSDCDNDPVPGFSIADTASLTWNPDYALTTAPDAQREFRQLQVNLEIAVEEWGGSLSAVKTDLKGNLDNVSGYTDPDSYNAGPYVRVNEGVNAFGTLENFSDLEWKASVWGMLPGELQVGAFYTYRSGDHYSPQFQLYGLGFFEYRVGTGALRGDGTTTFPGEELSFRALHPLEDHDLYVGPRGQPTLARRANLDLRLERAFELQGRDLSVSVDMFNVFGSEAINELNTMVNNGPNYGFDTSLSPLAPPLQPNLYYKAPQDRVPPRSFRIGVSAYF